MEEGISEDYYEDTRHLCENYVQWVTDNYPCFQESNDNGFIYESK
jgi:hypothetical protein